MFGVSFSEIVMIAVVALVVVGPRRLPEILGTMGRWVARLRQMTIDMRRQTGIDEILRAEGLSGGINELRAMMRGEAPRAAAPPPTDATPKLPPDAVVDAYGEAVEYDRFRECPLEGPDSYGAIPEDLAEGLPDEAASATPEATPKPLAAVPGPPVGDPASSSGGAAPTERGPE